MPSSERPAKLTILRVVAKHDGEWGWYPFENAFPPGSFHDVPPNTTAMDILRQLEAEGLVTIIPGEPQSRYALTEKGRLAIRACE